jgi:peptidoglycan hydrolase-like protein with peptidoglycan-binding domain
MDAYVLLSGGTEQARAIQRWLNGRYLDKSTYFIGPCDGLYSRDVQKALVKALQYEFGVPADQATGNFGPATQAGLRSHPVNQGDSGIFVQLFSAACVFNGTIADTSTSFKDSFDGKLTEWVRAFQAFSALEQTGRGDYPTWAQLLVSMGDPDRPAGAGDTRHHISLARAKALKAAARPGLGSRLRRERLRRR